MSEVGLSWGVGPGVLAAPMSNEYLLPRDKPWDAPVHPWDTIPVLPMPAVGNGLVGEGDDERSLSPKDEQTILRSTLSGSGVGLGLAMMSTGIFDRLIPNFAVRLGVDLLTSVAGAYVGALIGEKVGKGIVAERNGLLG